MLAFIIDNLGSILIGAVVLTVLVLISVHLVKARKNGGACSCSDGCSSCPGCCGCAPSTHKH